MEITIGSTDRASALAAIDPYARGDLGLIDLILADLQAHLNLKGHLLLLELDRSLNDAATTADWDCDHWVLMIQAREELHRRIAFPC